MVLLFKLTATPLLILLISQLVRRLGPSLGGIFIGLPLTAGPISYFLALQSGRDFAQLAAINSLAGQVSTCSFCLSYSLAARKGAGPGLSVFIGLSVFFALTAAFSQIDWSLPLAATAFVLGLLALERVFPKAGAEPPRRAATGWDMPLRMGAGAVFVVGLTAIGSFLGPQLSGLASTMPVIGLVLAIFTHMTLGKSATITLLHSTIYGSPAFGAFFFVLALTLQTLPLALCYLLAAIASVAASAAAWGVLRFMGSR